jgi:hypothetical protein
VNALPGGGGCLDLGYDLDAHVQHLDEEQLNPEKDKIKSGLGQALLSHPGDGRLAYSLVPLSTPQQS